MFAPAPLHEILKFEKTVGIYPEMDLAVEVTELKHEGESPCSLDVPDLGGFKLQYGTTGVRVQAFY